MSTVPRDLRWLARGAALVSAVALAWVPGAALLERTLGGRSAALELRTVLLIAVPYLVLALLPWPPARAGRRWFALLLLGVAFVGPTWAVAVTVPLGPVQAPTLPIGLLAQLALFFAGVNELRRQRAEPGQPRFSAAFWALVLAALNPGVWIGAMVALVGTHGGHGAVSATVGDLRSFVSAETAYMAASAWYGRPECLDQPTDCLADYPPEAPIFQAESDLVLVRRGYLRTFHPVPAPPDLLEDSAGGLAGFALLAVPLEGRESLPAFCADHTGLICIFRDGSVPRAGAEGCPVGCDPL